MNNNEHEDNDEHNNEHEGMILLITSGENQVAVYEGTLWPMEASPC